jgi:hypothetical protein
MKVADWVRYNESVLRFDDVIVKVFRSKSCCRDDMAMKTKICFDDMAQIFAEYTIMFITLTEYKTESAEIERTTLCFGIYYEVEEPTNDGTENT